MLQHETANHEFRWHDDGRTANKQLSNGVNLQRRRGKTPPIFAYEVSSRPRAQPQSGHETREHNRHHSRGDPELRHGEAKPDQLVENAAKSGNEKEGEIPPPAAVGDCSFSRSFRPRLWGRNFHLGWHCSSAHG